MLRFLSGCQTEALGGHYDPRVNPGVSALRLRMTTPGRIRIYAGQLAS